MKKNYDFMTKQRITAVVSDIYKDFDEFAILNVFGDEVGREIINQCKTDGGNDHCVDYFVIKLDGEIISDEEDFKDLEASKKHKLEIDLIQVKDSSSLQSYLFESHNTVFESLFDSDAVLDHFNAQIIETRRLVIEILRKFYRLTYSFNYYYIGNFIAPPKSTDTLNGERRRLLKKYEKENYNFNIAIIDRIKLLSYFDSKEYDYTFESADKIVSSIHNQINGALALVKITELKKFVTSSEDGTILDQLFERNIRDFKGETTYVNDSIKKMLSTPEEGVFDFWWYNNGLTIITEELQIDSLRELVSVKNPKIVNGLQTTYSIYNSEIDDSDNRRLLVKFLEITDVDDDRELDVIISTNSQNEIRLRNIRANDPIQIAIETFFHQNGNYYYQRKEKFYTNRGHKTSEIVGLQELSQFVNSVYLRKPSLSRRSPAQLLKDHTYKMIFKTDKIHEQEYSRYLNVVALSNAIRKEMPYKVIEGVSIQNFHQHLLLIAAILISKKKTFTSSDLDCVADNGVDVNIINDTVAIMSEIMKNAQLPPLNFLKNDISTTEILEFDYSPYFL